MKTKIIVLVMIFLQLCLALCFLVASPEILGSIKVGLENLQTAAPSEAPTGAKTVEGDSILKTPGDFFVVSEHLYQSQCVVTQIAIAINILLLIWLFVIAKRETSSKSKLTAI